MSEEVDLEMKLWECVERYHEKLNSGSLLDADFGPGSCPLCLLFYKRDCEGCPIKEDTGERQCIDTPYDDIHVALRWQMGVEEDTPEDAKRRAKLRAKMEAEMEVAVIEELGYLVDLALQYGADKVKEEKARE